MGWPVARLDDTSNHGGKIITATAPNLTDAGKPVARIGDLHACPIPLHGVTEILTGSPNFVAGGIKVARGDGADGSVTGCGAILIGGSSKFVCD